MSAPGAFDAGSVRVGVGANFDDRGFDRFFKRVKQAREEKDVTTHLRVDADTKGADRYHKAVDDTNKRGDDVVRSQGRIRTAFGSVWMRGGAAFAAAGGAYALGAAFKSVIGTSSDINESLAKNQVLFGSYSKQIDNFSRTSAASFGISRKAALEYTGVFGNLFNAIGVNNRESAKYSQNLTKLAADMASFNNTSIDEALEAIRSGLVGETEPLRKFGVNLNDAQLRQQAMAMGLTKTTKEVLTPHDKALAAVALTTKQTAAAHGDFERTSGGLANQLRILQARASDLAGTLGEHLLPPVTKAVTFINNLFSGKGTGDGGPLKRIFNDVLGFVTGVIDDNREALEGIAGSAQRMYDTLKRTFSGVVDAFKQTFGKDSSTGQSIRQIIAVLLDFEEEVYGVLERILHFVGPSLQRTFEGLFKIVKGAIDLIAGILTLNFGKAWDGVKEIFGGAVRAIIGILGVGVAPLRGAASKLWDGIGSGVTAAWESVKGVVSSGLDFVLGGFTSALDVMGDALDKVPSVVRKLIPGFNDVRESIRNTQHSVDDYRDSLHKAKKPTDAQADSLTALKVESTKAWEKTRTLKRGTDEYKDAVADAREKTRHYRGALKDAKDEAKNAAKPVAILAGNFAGLGQVVANSLDSVGANVNSVLSDLGAKALKYTIKKPKSAGEQLGAVAGALGNLFATGGVPNPGSGNRDDHVLFDPSGNPVAALSGTEGIVNTPQMGVINSALAFAKQAAGLPWGSLGELWNSGMSHFATGGVLARANALDRMRLPYVWGGHHGEAGPIQDPRPGLDCSSAVSYVLGIPPRVSGALESIGAPGPGPITIFANPVHTFMSIAGRGFGTSAENPGGGPGWLSYNSRPGFVVRHVTGDLGAGATSVRAPTIVGPDSILKTIAQRSGQKVAGAANKYIGTQLGGMDFTGGQPLREGSLGKSGLSKLWRSVGGAQGASNMAGAVAMAESRGDPNAQHINADGSIDRGFWQINSVHGALSTFDPTRNAQAARIISQNGRNWSPWSTVKNGAYRAFMRLGGKLKHFKNGGGLARQVGGDSYGVTPARSAARAPRGQQITEFNHLKGELEDKQKRYEQHNRKYDQSDEQFIKDDGTLDQGAIDHRLGELRSLKKTRERIRDILKEMNRIAKRVVRSYKEAIKRLTESLKHAKKKKRSGIRDQIRDMRTALGDWKETAHDLPFDIEDARLDVGDIGNEIAAVKGTTAEPPETADTDTDTGGDDTGGDTATPEQLPPTPEQIATAAAAQLADFNTGRQSLFSQFGSNFVTAGAGNVVGRAVASAPGAAYFGAETSGAEGAAAGGKQTTIYQTNVFPEPPPDPHTWANLTKYETEAAG